MIPLSHTYDYRDENNILDSECIEIIEAEERSESEEEDGENENDTIYVQSQLHKDRQLNVCHTPTVVSRFGVFLPNMIDPDVAQFGQKRYRPMGVACIRLCRREPLEI